MNSDALPVTPAVVRWARTRAGFSLEDATKYFKKISAWEEGYDAPTYPQLEQMAEKFKCPVAVFFFPQPPDLPSAENSFRTLSYEVIAAIPRTVRKFLRQAQAMQLNLSELNDGINPAQHLITRELSISPNTSLEKLAAAVRQFLGVSLVEQLSWGGVDKALDTWRDAFARVGVFVFKEAFRSDEYFGFSLYDAEFPIVYINNTSAKSRQIFTLFHELGHLLFHTSGIDIVNGDFINRLQEDGRKIEVMCNVLAARVLVPDDEFARRVKGQAPDRNTAAFLADQFSVSREVIYRKMLDRGLIDQREYTSATKFWASQVKSAREGGNYYNSHYAYLGSRYVELAFTRYHERRFDDIRLAEYLNLKPKSLPAFAAKFGGGA